jgi:hypothetical protein
MTISLGWWLIPTVITIILLAVTLYPSRQTGFGDAIIGAFEFLAALIVILISWLIWSLLT